MTLRVHLKPAFGKLRLDAIGPKQIEAYKATKVAARKTPKTINNHLTVLRKLLHVAAEWGKLKSIPPIRWMKVPQPEFDFLTFEESDRLIAATEPSWRAMIVVALRAGLRLGELCALRWDDVDLVAGRLLVRQSVARGIVGTPKNGRMREIPLSAFTVEALKAHRRGKAKLVFAQHGRMNKKDECKWPLRRACRNAGLREVGWHALRHTFASQLAMKGVPLGSIQELLGHSTIEMTMRYAHLSPEVGRAAVSLLDGQGTYKAHGPELAPKAS